MSNQPTCYKVLLPATNAMRDTAHHDGEYIDVEPMCTSSSGWCGLVYTIAQNISEVAAEFPEAISIERVGIAFHMPETLPAINTDNRFKTPEDAEQGEVFMPGEVDG